MWRSYHRRYGWSRPAIPRTPDHGQAMALVGQRLFDLILTRSEPQAD
jgi:hypothetical protein